MINKLKQRKEEGFTIIEVMIVLAIAGLIMLVIFLAVPALQRNSRNTALKNDAQAFAAAVAEYASNNDGKIPGNIAGSSSTIVVGASSTAQSVAKINFGTKLGAKSKPTAYKVGTLYWNTGTDCSNVANPRAVTIYYFPESQSKSNNPACIDAQ